MRVACVFIKSLPIRVALICNPDRRGQPLVIGGSPSDAGPVCDASPEAMACGVQPGMALRQAYALCPEAVFLPSDEDRCRKAFGTVADVLEHFGPTVEMESLGCAYLDVTGVSDGEALGRHMMADILARTELRGCVGISSSKFFSHAAALTSTPEEPAVVPCGVERDFIAPFSIDFLPCSAGTRERLHNFGIRSIGQLTRFSKEALVAQFGSEGTRIHELAHGIDGSPLIPRKKADALVFAADIEPPAVTASRLLSKCQTLLEKPLQEARARGGW